MEGSMCGAGECDACPTEERDVRGWLGWSPPSLSTNLTLTVLSPAVVMSHEGCAAFSSVLHALLRISLQSTVIAFQSLPCGGV